MKRSKIDPQLLSQIKNAEKIAKEGPVALLIYKDGIKQLKLFGKDGPKLDRLDAILRDIPQSVIGVYAGDDVAAYIKDDLEYMVVI